MTRLSWNAPAERFFETGLDRGVLYRNAAPAVAWNGLNAVDESGAESLMPYFIDGRPFFFYSRPKEYQADLKAYTYPDEFAALMGLTEIEDAEGIFIDSQVGDTFGLSYRTLVGNGIDGLDHGYKIHLIYNAFVAPQSNSYESLSTSINPNMFAWEIQAAPLAVEGYRGSAHLVIDSRRMSPANLLQLETILYGDGVTDPSLPTPNEILDLFRYGDHIVITDHGDGTWSALGAAANVYSIDDKIFEIKDVDGLDNGDGTFEIHTT